MLVVKCFEKIFFLKAETSRQNNNGVPVAFMIEYIRPRQRRVWIEICCWVDENGKNLAVFLYHGSTHIIYQYITQPYRLTIVPFGIECIRAARQHRKCFSSRNLFLLLFTWCSAAIKTFTRLNLPWSIDMLAWLASSRTTGLASALTSDKNPALLCALRLRNLLYKS